MKDAGVTTEQLDWLVLHQANQRILDAAAQRIGISSERVVSNLAEYGNTSAASIPLAFDEAVRSGKIKSGDTVSSQSSICPFSLTFTFVSAFLKGSHGRLHPLPLLSGQGMIHMYACIWPGAC